MCVCVCVRGSEFSVNVALACDNSREGGLLVCVCVCVGGGGGGGSEFSVNVALACDNSLQGGREGGQPALQDL